MSRDKLRDTAVSVIAKGLPLLRRLHAPSALAVLKFGTDLARKQPDSVRDKLVAPACALANHLARKGNDNLAREALRAPINAALGRNDPDMQGKLFGSLDQVVGASLRKGRGAEVLSLIHLMRGRFRSDPTAVAKATSFGSATAKEIVQQGEDPLPVVDWFERILPDTRHLQGHPVRNGHFTSAKDVVCTIAQTNGSAGIQLCRTLLDYAQTRSDEPLYMRMVINSTCNTAHAAAEAGQVEAVGPLLELAYGSAQKYQPALLPDVLRTMIQLEQSLSPKGADRALDLTFLRDASQQDSAMFNAALRVYVTTTGRLATSYPDHEEISWIIRGRVASAVRVAQDYAQAHPDEEDPVPAVLTASLELARTVRNRQREWGTGARDLVRAAFALLDEDGPRFGSYLELFGRTIADMALLETTATAVPDLLATAVNVCSDERLAAGEGIVSTAFALSATRAEGGLRAAVVFPADRRTEPVAFNGDFRGPLSDVNGSFNMLGKVRVALHNRDWFDGVSAKILNPHDEVPSFAQAIMERRNKAHTLN